MRRPSRAGAACLLGISLLTDLVAPGIAPAAETSVVNEVQDLLFYWIKRRVQRRPHLSLLHRIVVAGSGSTIHVERYFYVEHSFNANEILTGAFAHRDGTLVFSTNRVSTDEVLGVGNQLKRTIGRAQLRDEMRTRLDRLQAFLIRPRSTQSQTRQRRSPCSAPESRRTRRPAA